MDLAVKYRPVHLDEVIGQPRVIASLTALTGDWPHCLLFAGPAGTGKTTLARIIATGLLGCADIDLVEIDAATYTGIDDMRRVSETMGFQGIGGGVRVVIVDECHALSRQAWQSLLKIVEEPPPYGYFFFCTTELGKVPATIRSRAHEYKLTPIGTDDLATLVERVATKEKIPCTKGAVPLIARLAQGSARKALHLLSQSRGLPLRAIESLGEETSEVIDLCRALAQPRVSWKTTTRLVQALEGDYEAVRRQICGYLSAVVLRGKSPDPVLLHRLDCFSETTYGYGKAQLVLAVGRAALGES